MKRAPWVRFAIRIRPKISEKPADSRNSRAPSARLFSVWMTQNCSLGLQVLRRREVARVHRVLQELLRLYVHEGLPAGKVVIIPFTQRPSIPLTLPVVPLPDKVPVGSDPVWA